MDPKVQKPHTFYPHDVPAIGTLLPESSHPQNKNSPHLFRPITLRGMTAKNRIWVAFAVRGAGAITMEATAVTPEGRISPEDAGLWTDSQMAPLRKIVEYSHAHETKIGVQLAHAGRKASTLAPWISSRGSKALANAEAGGWPDDVIGPSAISFGPGYPDPKAMTLQDIERVKKGFVLATRRCLEIGFDFIELHGAHGYLMHSFLSPLSNHRQDHYGGSLENRMRFPLEVAQAVRAEWPDKPLIFRISASDWAEGPELESETWKQWGVQQSIIFSKELQRVANIDMIDCSSGGNWKDQKIEIKPGYQVHFAAELKKALPDLPVGCVGLITEARQAESYLAEGKGDVIYLARELLRHPDFALSAAKELGVAVKPAKQYERAWADMMRAKF